jgi:DNA-binding transcriptional MerR regulator
MSKTDEIIEKVENSETKWFDVADVSILAEIPPKSVRDNKKIERTIDPDDGFIYISKKNVLDLIERNRPAIDGWPRSEEIAKEFGFSYWTIRHYVEKHGIRHRLDHSRKKRIHPDDKDKLVRLLSNKETSDPLVENGITYHMLTRVAKEALKYDGNSKKEKAHLEDLKYKVFYKWVMDEDSDLGYKRFGNAHRVYVPEETYKILLNSITIMEASRRSPISYETIQRYIRLGYLNRHKISASSKMLCLNDVYAARRISNIVSHLKSKKIKFNWKEDASARMKDSINYIEKDETIRIFYNNTQIILVDFFSGFFKMFGEWISDYSSNMASDIYHGKVNLDPKVFFEMISKNKDMFRLI